MKFVYLLALFYVFFNQSSATEGSHRFCIVLPINSIEKVDFEFHTEIINYVQGSDWCVAASTNTLQDILKKYSGNINKFIEDPSFRAKLAEVSNAKTFIYLDIWNSTYRLDIWEIDGKISSTKLSNDLNINEVINELEKYKKSIPYKGIVSSSDESIVVIDGGTRFGFDSGDSVKFLKNGRAVFHPRTKEFISFNYDEGCFGLVKMSNYKNSFINLNEGCKEDIKVGDWVKLIDVVKINTQITRKESEKKILDMVAGMGLSSFDVASSGSSNTSFSGPKFSFSFDSDLLLTRNIVVGMNLTGLFSILTLSDGTSDADLVNTFGNQWSSYLSYRYWLEGFSSASFIDFGIGYNSNYFGFNSNQADFLSGQKYYGVSIRGNMSLSLFGIDFFSRLSFLPSGNFSQDIKYINAIDSVSGYSIQVGAYFDLFSYQNLFSLLKIEKYKASSSLISRETSIQDIGIVFGYKFRI